MPRRDRYAVHALVAAGLALGVAGCSASPPLREVVTVDRHLSVEVVQEDGAPVRWAWLEISRADGHPLFAGHAEDGTFTRALPAGSYLLRAFDGAAALAPRTVDVAVDRDVRLGHGGAPENLHVDVRYADGSPVAFAWIEVYDADGRAVFGGNAPRGAFDLAVAPGEHRVRAFDGARIVGDRGVELSTVADHAVGFVVPADPGDDYVHARGAALAVDGQPFVVRGLDVYNANSRGSCWTDLVDHDGFEGSLRSIGSSANTVRAWFFQEMAQSGDRRDWSVFDRTFAQARRYGVRVVATLENEWADCNSAGEKSSAWYRDGYRHPQGRQLVPYRDWVKEFARRYADESQLLALQLMNEASDANGAACPDDAAVVLQTWAADMVSAVKGDAGDRRHLLSVGTVGGSPASCGTRGEEWKALYAVPGIDLCEYHDYQGVTALPAIVQAHITECTALGKPILAGELGVADDDPLRLDHARAKIDAQLAAGAAGVLVWKWAAFGARAPDGDAAYNVVPGDALLTLLSRY
jgi:mannan endo-1,4-beta-mannosidase